MEVIELAVAKGAQFLDEKLPGWHKQLDLETLELASCENCVCGQLGRSLGFGYLLQKTGVHMEDYPEEYGFDIPYVEDPRLYSDYELYRLLDAEWHKAITTRLKLDVLSQAEKRKEIVHDSC